MDTLDFSELSMDDIHDLIAKIEPEIRYGDFMYSTYTIMLAALVVGANIDKISVFTGIPKDEIVKYEEPLRKAGIWDGEFTCSTWFDAENDSFNKCGFICDGLVAVGLAEKSYDADGEPCYGSII